MPKYLIERTVPGAHNLSPDQLKEISAKSNSVVQNLGEPYVWEHTYVAGDKLFCVHEASGPDAIRRHAEAGGFPVDKITEISSTFGPLTASF